MNYQLETSITTIRGCFTFLLSDSPIEALPSIGKMYDGRKWIEVADVNEARQVAQAIFRDDYDSSARAMPTGFATITDAAGNIVAGVSPNGLAWAYSLKDGRKLHYSDLGLADAASKPLKKHKVR